MEADKVTINHKFNFFKPYLKEKKDIGILVTDIGLVSFFILWFVVCVFRIQATPLEKVVQKEGTILSCNTLSDGKVSCSSNPISFKHKEN